MKSSIKYCLLTLLVFVFSCKKGTNDNLLIGKWKLTEYYISMGPPGSWQAVDKKLNSYIQINRNGTLAGNSYPDYKTYLIKSSTIVTFYKADGTYEDYYYTITNGGLTLSPAGPIFCIEGCADRYVKIITPILYYP